MIPLSSQDPDQNPEYDNPLGQLPNGFQFTNDDLPTGEDVDFNELNEHSETNRAAKCTACAADPLKCSCRCPSCRGRRGAAKRKQEKAEIDAWAEEHSEALMIFRRRSVLDYQRNLEHVAIFDPSVANNLKKKMFNLRWTNAIAAPAYARWDGVCSRD